MHIHHLTLYCDNPDQQQRWYAQRGWHIDNTGAIVIGHTSMRFVASDKPYRYHYAIAAPVNSIRAVQRWCEHHVDLITSPTHDAVYAFDEWNADALYFRDTAGNIGEFIARRDRQQATPANFTLADCIGICEIGVAATHVPSLVQHLKSHYGLQSYFSHNDTFYPIGGDDGLFIVVDSTREWYPDTGVIAGHTPMQVHLQTPDGQVSLRFDEPQHLPQRL